MIAHPRSQLKLVLMSATFNHSQYNSFFRNVPGCEYVDTITLQTADSIDAFHSRVQTYYLDDISRVLSRSTDGHVDYCAAMKVDPLEELSSVDDGKALSEKLLNCIEALVVHLHEQVDLDGIFLIFTPTYREYALCCLRSPAMHETLS